ncbi:DUF4129 domain-containing protein [Flavobacterium sp. NST-5]|uniref:DUF4129 domain-containing protein n=1 Tax=Flavobacterium ichthyis TaxID=2698827 RepID=A0ABW9Z9E0_9FLAO|nr:DUF4129 domain-containing protein [Flavobacterium ichthyis]NBL65341.1 DUF4129 domain-containing protein [Flavobacterium ichthyis]
MNKFLLIIAFIFCGSISAQDTVSIAQDSVKVAVKFTEDMILKDSSDIKPLSFEENFQEKYTDSDYEYEAKPRGENWWDRFLEWLAYWFQKIFGMSSSQSAGNVINIILQILAVLVVLFVIYLIAKAILNKEGRWIFGKSSDAKMIRYEDLEKNLQLVNFEKLIDEAMQNGEQRLVVRYYYLWLLKKMSASGIIKWDPEKTNSDYVYEISSEKLKSEFSYLSYLYNYIWYGEFALEENTFEKTVKAFRKTISTL